MSNLVNELRQGSLSYDDYRWLAADELELLRKENEKLRAALNPFADESLWSKPQHEFVTVKRSDCDRARAALEGK